jgi:hypothetical protein
LLTLQRLFLKDITLQLDYLLLIFSILNLHLMNCSKIGLLRNILLNLLSNRLNWLVVELVSKLINFLPGIFEVFFNDDLLSYQLLILLIKLLLGLMVPLSDSFIFELITLDRSLSNLRLLLSKIFSLLFQLFDCSLKLMVLLGNALLQTLDFIGLLQIVSFQFVRLINNLVNILQILSESS